MIVERESLPIPDSLDEVTDDWLTAVLGTTVVRQSSEPLSVGTTGRVYRLRLRGADSDDRSTLIVKLPAEDLGQRAYYDARGMYVQEAAFYRLLAADAPMRTPRAWFARAEGDPRRMGIVLEDLTTRGYTLGDQLGGTSIESAVAAVRELAALHARWWDDRSLDQHDWLPHPNQWPHVEELRGRWDVCPPDFREEIDAATAEAIELMLGRLDSIHDAAARRPLTITHGDFRFDNLGIGPAGEIAAFDWQLVARAPGARDLAFFAGLTAIPDVDPGSAWRQLVDAYLRQLDGLGVSYPRDELDYDLRLNAFYFFRVALGAFGSMDLAHERNRRLARYIVGRLGLVERRLSLREFLREEFPG